MGRVTHTTHPDGSRTRVCYDDGVTVTLDANRHKRRTKRDAFGRVVTVEEYTGTHTTCTTGRGRPYATTTYTYDPLGNLTTVTDALGNQMRMTYDTLSRKTRMRDPDLGAWTYHYDGYGNLTQQTDAKGQHVHFQYDTLHRRVQKDYGTPKPLGAGDVVYTYDGPTANRHGRLAQVADVSGLTRFHYDVAGRVTRTDKWVESPVGAVVPTGYPTSRWTRRGHDVQATQYTVQTTYDGLGRVTSLTYPEPVAVSFTGAAMPVRPPPPAHLRMEGDVYRHTDALYRLDPATGAVTRVGRTTGFGVGETQPAGLASHAGVLYAVGASVQVLSLPEGATLSLPTPVTYTYTGPQLQSVQEGATTYAHYSGFNALGQPGTVTRSNGTTTTYTYDAKNYRLKTLKTVRGSTVLQDLGYTFDAGGNVAAITDPRHGEQSFAYDDLDRLTGATNGAPGGYGTLNYTYNQIGNLLRHSDVGTYTYPASGPESVRPHAVTRTQLPTGTETTYTYDANGNLRQGGGRVLTWDAENRPTQIQNLWDPQSLNRYAYARNNPLRYNDPTGHCCNDCGGCGTQPGDPPSSDPLPPDDGDSWDPPGRAHRQPWDGCADLPAV